MFPVLLFDESHIILENRRLSIFNSSGIACKVENINPATSSHSIGICTISSCSSMSLKYHRSHFSRLPYPFKILMSCSQQTQCSKFRLDTSKFMFLATFEYVACDYSAYKVDWLSTYNDMLLTVKQTSSLGIRYNCLGFELKTFHDIGTNFCPTDLLRSISLSFNLPDYLSFRP